jgi:hypothetical protein
MMEPVHASEKSVYFHETSRRQIPEVHIQVAKVWTGSIWLMEQQ